MNHNLSFLLALVFQIIFSPTFVSADPLAIENQSDSTMSNFVSLRWSEKEVTEISNIIPGKVFLYQAASEKVFKEHAPKANIIHLATHAIINDQAPLYSQLIFSRNSDSTEDGFLNTYELYNMKLNASLAVLSACKTGAGKLVPGEGIMGLARGFMYAGCPNVLVSLWPVDDKSTASIMKNFYLGLTTGVDADEALRRAKLDYLKNADDAKSAPFYWAGFILIGDSNSIVLSRHSHRSLWIAILILLIAIFAFAFRRNFFSRRMKATAFLSLLTIPILALIVMLNQEESYSQKPANKTSPENAILNDHFLIAKKFQDQAQYDSSIFYFEKAGLDFKNEQKWLEFLTCYNNIGGNLKARGEYEKAIRILNAAIEIGLTELGENHSALAPLYNTLGHVLRKKGEIDRAAEYFNQSLTISLNDSHPDSLEQAASYHGLGVVNYLRGEYDKALELHQKSLSIRSKILGLRHPLVADNFVNIGIVSVMKGDYDAARKYYDRALAIRREVLGDNHPDVANSYLNLGVVSSEKGDFENALIHYQKALSIIETTMGKNHPSIAGNYLNMGLVFDKKGDYDKALQYYQKSLSMTLEIMGEQHPLVAENYNNMGIVYKKLGDYDRALDFYNQALAAYFKRLGANHPEVIKIYFNIANVYSLKSQYGSAIELYQKALSIARRAFGEIHPLIAIIYDNIGILNSSQGRYKHALAYFDQALSMGHKIYGEKHPFISEVNEQVGQVYFKQNYFEKALEYYQHAIIALVSNFQNQDFYVNPALKNSSEETRLLSLLALKAKALERLYSLKTKNIKDLTFSLLTYELALALIDNIARSYQAEGAQLFLREQAHDVYVHAIQTALLLYEMTKKNEYSEKAFLFAEKSKASVLRQALLDFKARQFAGIPDSLLENERQLKIDLAMYDKHLYEELGKGDAGDRTKIDFWQNKLFELKRDHEALVDKFEMEYSAYYNLKYQTAVITPQKLQEKIADTTSAVIEYVVGDSLLFIFTILKNDFGVVTLKIDSTFESQIEAMRTGLGDKDFSCYTEAAHRLYQILIAPIENKIRQKKFIIIPDGLLGYLPFETLLSKSPDPGVPDYRSLSYLINDCQITYHYSSTLLYETITRANSAPCEINYMGFAPVNFQSKKMAIN